MATIGTGHHKKFHEAESRRRRAAGYPVDHHDVQPHRHVGTHKHMDNTGSRHGVSGNEDHDGSAEYHSHHDRN